MDLVTWIWIGAGLALMVAELIVPGLVIVFMGAAAVLVGLLRWLGVVETLPASLGLWMALSVVLAVALRNLLRRYLPAETRRDLFDEEVEAMDQLVEVVVDCDAHSKKGRIRYQGTTWPAQMVSGAAAAGSRVRLLYRDNLSWVVEAPPPAARIERERPEHEE